MTTAVLENFGARPTNSTSEDIEYLRHGDKPLLARVSPRGEGPFPALVECHGGAWCHERPHSPRAAPRSPWRRMASCRSRSISAPATRTLSGLGAGHQLCGALGQAQCARAQDPGGLVGLSGQSSGGHLAMLVAMRPNDPRYAAIPLPAGSPRMMRACAAS